MHASLKIGGLTAGLNLEFSDIVAVSVFLVLDLVV